MNRRSMIILFLLVGCFGSQQTMFGMNKKKRTLPDSFHEVDPKSKRQKTSSFVNPKKSKYDICLKKGTKKYHCPNQKCNMSYSKYNGFYGHLYWNYACLSAFNTLESNSSNDESSDDVYQPKKGIYNKYLDEASGEYVCKKEDAQVSCCGRSACRYKNRSYDHFIDHVNYYRKKQKNCSDSSDDESEDDVYKPENSIYNKYWDEELEEYVCKKEDAQVSCCGRSACRYTDRSYDRFSMHIYYYRRKQKKNK